MSDKEGYYIRQTEVKSCGLCKWLEREMVISGRKPLYDFYCGHTKMIEKEHESNIRGIVNKKDVRFIGESTHTPDWCPVGKIKE